MAENNLQPKKKREADKEAIALNVCTQALLVVDKDASERIIAYLKDRFVDNRADASCNVKTVKR